MGRSQRHLRARRGFDSDGRTAYEVDEPSRVGAQAQRDAADTAGYALRLDTSLVRATTLGGAVHVEVAGGSGYNSVVLSYGDSLNGADTITPPATGADYTYTYNGAFTISGVVDYGDTLVGADTLTGLVTLS